MANKIGMSEFAAQLAISTGRQKEICENFLYLLLEIISEELVEGREVKIKGFGTFKFVRVEQRKSVNISNGENIEIPSHKRIIFVPAKEFSSDINSFFEFFETIELAEDLPDAFFDETFDEESFEQNVGKLIEGEEEEEPKKIMEIQSSEEELDDELSSEAYHYMMKGEEKIKGETGNKSESIPEESNQEIKNETREKEPELPVDVENEGKIEEVRIVEDTDNSLIEDNKNKNYRFGFGFVSGLACCLIICGVLFVIGLYNGWYDHDIRENEEQVAQKNEEINIITEVPRNIDSVGVESAAVPVKEKNIKTEEDVVPTEVSDKPIYDYVSTTRYLTTIAREHYGNYNFWPYIYEENKAILGHPDRIKPGTQVVVPDLKKYGVSVNSKKDLKEAKRKGAEIYARYKNYK